MERVLEGAGLETGAPQNAPISEPCFCPVWRTIRHCPSPLFEEINKMHFEGLTTKQLPPYYTGPRQNSDDHKIVW